MTEAVDDPQPHVGGSTPTFHPSAELDPPRAGDNPRSGAIGQTPLATTVQRHLHHHMTVVTVLGPLSDHHGHDLFSLITACVEECPAAVLVDLTAVTDAPPVVLAAIAQAGARVPPGIPPVAVFACGAAPHHHMLLAPHVSVYETPAQAREATLDLHRSRPRTELTFDASIHAPARVRQLVTDTCDQLSLQHVRTDATLIMSELVTNVVQHTAKSGVAALTHRDPFLHLEVEDHEPRPPVTNAGHRNTRQDHGRGLAIIGLLGSRWGYRVGHDGGGKVVWASLPTRRPSAT
jgi:anti-sigma regulatory factor (Ser/Thr protein kinase)